MSITVTPARTKGRVVIRSDGCSAAYDGALIQGSAICHISSPEDVVARYSDVDGLDLRRLLRDLRDRKWNGLRGVRVLNLRYVA